MALGTPATQRLSSTAAAVAATLPPRPPKSPSTFLNTLEHRRFIEFADAVRANRIIGLCTGPPGIGKTLSARQYSGADPWEVWIDGGWTKDPVIPATTLTARTAMWTPRAMTTPRELDQALPTACQQVSWAISMDLNPDHVGVQGPGQGCAYTELLIVDEADRLKTINLEQIRDFYDRHNMGVILIGIPGLERRLSRYAQLYSRVGFAHYYRPLNNTDLLTVLAHHWHQTGQPLDPTNPDHAEAIAAVTRITGGNFRLITQTRRIMTINGLQTITTDAIEAARATLVIGA